MRSLIVFGAFTVLIAATFIYPFAGLLTWAWFSFMQPHQEAYGAATTFQFDLYAAVLTMIAWLVSTEKKVIPLGTTTTLLILFGLWVSITTYFAIDPDFAYLSWSKCEKSLLLALFVATMATTRVRIQTLIWVIAISLGYFAIKGAGYVLTGGEGHVVGPATSMIADNNALSVALVSIVPLLIYLVRSSDKLVTRIAVSLVAMSVVVSVVGTYSRGGFVALLGLGALLALRSRARLSLAVAAIVALGLIVLYAPPAWRERMNTIVATEGDQSYEGRVQAWKVAWNVATERPITGGGFRFGEQQRIWDRYAHLDQPVQFHAAHNIYFQVLGEHGFVGLIIYLLILASTIRNTQVSVKLSGQSEPWVSELANALQLSILTVAIGGLSLSIAYYDVYLTLYALTFALRRLVQQSMVSQNFPVPDLTPVTAIARANRF